MNDVTHDRVVIYRSEDADSCRQRGLVLSAIGISCEIRQGEGRFAVFVGSVDAERGAAELNSYALEDIETIVPGNRTDIVDSGFYCAIGFGVVLALVAFLAGGQWLDVDWFQAGKTSAGRIRQGEWWRAVTALTLHADGAHLTSNLVAGGVVCMFAAQMLGGGVVLLSMVLAGAAGNFLNALVRHAGHTSIGASTAVFAGLGLLAAQAWRRKNQNASTMEQWAPVVGGMLLLSILGTEGERTDVAAHACGFLCGALVGGSLGSRVRPLVMRRAVQVLCGVVALLLVAAAWWIALAKRTSG